MDFVIIKKLKEEFLQLYLFMFGEMELTLSIFLRLVEKENIKVIEDASESLGTFYKKGYLYDRKHTGTVGDIGCISFNGNKIITSGEEE